MDGICFIFSRVVDLWFFGVDMIANNAMARGLFMLYMADELCLTAQNCAVKHKVATWTSYALMSDRPSYALTAKSDGDGLRQPRSGGASVASVVDVKLSRK